MVNEDVEQVLGGKVLAWVGAVAVVAGFALLFAMGISRGWIGEGARTLTAAGVSLMLLFAGVWLHERRGQVQAARAAAATGICGLFMAATVATAVYHLLPTVAGLGLAFAPSAPISGDDQRSARIVASAPVANARPRPATVGSR